MGGPGLVDEPIPGLFPPMRCGTQNSPKANCS